MTHLPYYFKIIFLLFFFFAAFNCSAITLRQQTDSTKYNSAWYTRLAVIAEYQYFRTVHHSRFDGGYAFVDYNASANFAMGLGIGYNYSALHVDNGYNLRHVKVLPVLADFRYVPFANWTVRPFAVVDVGYSTFIKYDQEDPEHAAPAMPHTDHGLYTFGGGGILVKLNHKVTVFTSAGFTGMHMSFNNLDVNPRGLSNQFGIKVNLQ